jgi:hypothetical protein
VASVDTWIFLSFTLKKPVVFVRVAMAGRGNGRSQADATEAVPVG